MFPYLKARFVRGAILTGVLVTSLVTTQLGCGGSENRIEPSKNPTPLPDPESRIKVDGRKTSIPAGSDRKLGR
jgi:hypothetical protein